jgi:UDP-glucose 4-epimerase
MKILVTGGAGFIGSHVVDTYIQAGHQVVVVDDLSTGRRSNLNPNAKFYQIDIRGEELAQVFEQERPQVINHHAAQGDLRRAVSEPVFDADVNILGSIHLLELARQFEARKFIYISSGGAVYGEPTYLPCDEQHPVQPLSPYGASKYAFELYLYIYKGNFGLDYTILRYANVYGPRQDPLGEAGVVAIFCGRMLRGQQVTINGSGEQTRDFLYVGDCARANLVALEKGSGQVYNLGSGIETSINQVFEYLKALTNSSHAAHHAPPKTGETFRIYLDSQRAQQELAWEPTIDLQEGLSRTVAFFRKNEVK